MNAILSHNFIPLEMMDTVLTPIVKENRSDLTYINNYRTVALTNIISKVSELVILEKCKCNLNSSDIQFGFKCGHFTDLSVFLLKEIVSYFNSNKSPVYMAFLDAEIAFDSVCHWSLFDKLLQRNISSVFIRILMYWYSNQEFYIKWSNQLSSPFTVSNGVR